MLALFVTVWITGAGGPVIFSVTGIVSGLPAAPGAVTVMLPL